MTTRSVLVYDNDVLSEAFGIGENIFVSFYDYYGKLKHYRKPRKVR